MDRVFRRIPSLVGQKLKYVNIDRNEKTVALAQAIHLIELARVIYCVKHTAGNGLLFVSSKKVNLAIKYSSIRLLCDYLHTIASSHPQPFTLLSIPFYLIDQTKKVTHRSKVTSGQTFFLG